MKPTGPVNFGTILLLYRGCPLHEVKLYCHGPVGTTAFIERSNVLCPVFTVFFKRGPSVHDSIFCTYVCSYDLVFECTVTYYLFAHSA